MIFDNERSLQLLRYIASRVARMEPGHRLRVDRFDLRGISGFEHNGADFTPADRVLENVVGSSYTHSYSVSPLTGDVTFYRHEDTGERRYTSPDRREFEADPQPFLAINGWPE